MAPQYSSDLVPGDWEAQKIQETRKGRRTLQNAVWETLIQLWQKRLSQPAVRINLIQRRQAYNPLVREKVLVHRLLSILEPTH